MQSGGSGVRTPHRPLSYQKPLKKLRGFFYDISSIKYSRKFNIWFEDKSISPTKKLQQKCWSFFCHFLSKKF